MPFIRNLASSGNSPLCFCVFFYSVHVLILSVDRKLRTASLESLQTFLASRKTLTTTDAQKLWKGLFYALWMTDRPLPQQRLASDLADLLLSSVRPSCAIPWLMGFWTVVCAQWTDIDVLRLEKFLLLVRRVFAAHVRWARRQGFASDDVQVLLEEVMAAWPFEKEGDLRKVPVGVRLHVLDLWVDELEREGALAEDEGAKAFVASIGAMVEELRRCPVKSVRERAAESYQDDRLPWVEKAAEDDDDNDDDDDEGWGGIED